MISLCKQHGDKLDELTSMVKKIQTGLIGDEDKPGAITRISYLERTVTNMTRGLWIAGTVAIGIIVTAFLTKVL